MFLEDTELDPMQHAGDRSNQSIIIDTGKHAAATAICSAFSGICAAVAIWAVIQHGTDAREYREQYLTVQDEKQKERNHVIELEARLKSLVEEVQEMKHERR